MAVQSVENQQQMVKEVTVKEAVMKNPVQNENVQEHFTSDNFHLKIASIIYNLHGVASKHTSWSKLNPRLVLNIRACNWECTYCIEYMLVAGA